MLFSSNSNVQNCIIQSTNNARYSPTHSLKGPDMLWSRNISNGHYFIPGIAQCSSIEQNDMSGQWMPYFELAFLDIFQRAMSYNKHAYLPQIEPGNMFRMLFIFPTHYYSRGQRVPCIFFSNMVWGDGDGWLFSADEIPKTLNNTQKYRTSSMLFTNRRFLRWRPFCTDDKNTKQKSAHD